MSVDFSQYRVQDDDTSGVDIPRQLARSGARVAETIAGLPGDVAEVTLKPLNWIAQYTKEHLGFGKPKSEEELQKIRSEIPTSRKIRKFGEKITKGYLEPTTEAEKAADDFLQLATALAIPGPKTVAAKKVTSLLGKAGSLAGLATATKHGLKAAGVNEDEANIASFATMAIPGLLKGRNPRATVAELFKESEALLPEGAKISAQGIVPAMEKTIAVLQRGTQTPSKTAALRTAQDIIKKSRSGLINVDELTAFKRDINELMKDPELLRRAEKFLPGIGKEVDNLLEAYGKSNPEWIKKYRLANQMYGSLAKSERAVEQIAPFTKYVKNPFAAAALGIPFLGVTKTAAILGAKKGYELMHRIFTSPSLRRYYGNIIKEATKGNARATLQLMKEFDEKMDEEFPDVNWNQYRVD